MNAHHQSAARHAEVRSDFRGLRVLVVGLGRFGGGVGVTRWLVTQGACVTVTDAADPGSLTQSVDALSGLDVTWRLGRHEIADLDAADLVVINPAVHKARSKVFQEMRRRRIPWTTELNLFCERCRARVIGVTGTYGKSTTCAMLAHALRAGQAHVRHAYSGVHLGGNIGHSLLGDLSQIRPTDLVVLELSSAQLEDVPRIEWSPAIAVITNLSPHHLDRYETYTAYLSAKLNIFGVADRLRAMIVGELDAEAEAVLQQKLGESYRRIVRVRMAGMPLRVPGAHNRANAACALAVCEHLGLPTAVVHTAFAEFPGLPHRLEHVRTIGDVDYYNDSKSTSPIATIRALESLDRPVLAIVGGQNKAVSVSAMARALAKHCGAVICVGESGPAFAEAVNSDTPGFAREVSSLGEAVKLATELARPGDAVLFSPGAPSFDAFDNFAHRGQTFVDAVHALE